MLIGTLIVLLLLNACGGGSSGTGVKSFMGSVQFDDGQPAPAVEVIIPESGASTQTDKDGLFGVDTELMSDRSDVSLVTDGVESSVAVEAIPAGDAEILMSVVLDTQSRKVAKADVRVSKKKKKKSDSDDDDRPTPAPSVTPEATPPLFPGDSEGSTGPAPGVSPTVSPGSLPTETPTGDSGTPIPTVTPTPAASPTVAPTPTPTPQAGGGLFGRYSRIR
jgi:hypothetical protein